MRDIPGTQAYLYSKRSIALNMYEQLGTPQWFLTLTCHAKQPALLFACVYAQLLRDKHTRGESACPLELRKEVGLVVAQYFASDDYKWNGKSANDLCNVQPAVVARQFFHQVRKFLFWLAPATVENAS
eukprot:9409726-Prorocentrum_lima.AAC.1